MPSAPERANGPLLRLATARCPGGLAVTSRHSKVTECGGGLSCVRWARPGRRTASHDCPINQGHFLITRAKSHLQARQARDGRVEERPPASPAMRGRIDERINSGRPECRPRTAPQ